MGHFFASVSTLVLLSGLTLGQSSKDRFEVFGGYSLVTGDFTGTFLDRNNARVLNGWNASANFKVGRLLGFVADLSGYYPSDTGVGFRARSHSFLFGPQISAPLLEVLGRLTRNSPIIQVSDVSRP